MATEVTLVHDNKTQCFLHASDQSSLALQVEGSCLNQERVESSMLNRDSMQPCQICIDDYVMRPLPHDTGTVRRDSKDRGRAEVSLNVGAARRRIYMLCKFFGM